MRATHDVRFFELRYRRSAIRTRKQGLPRKIFGANESVMVTFQTVICRFFFTVFYLLVRFRGLIFSTFPAQHTKFLFLLIFLAKGCPRRRFLPVFSLYCVQFCEKRNGKTPTAFLTLATVRQAKTKAKARRICRLAR